MQIKYNNNLIECIEKNDISGLIIEEKDGNLIIKNSKLKLDKIYYLYYLCKNL